MARKLKEVGCSKETFASLCYQKQILRLEDGLEHPKYKVKLGDFILVKECTNFITDDPTRYPQDCTFFGTHIGKFSHNLDWEFTGRIKTYKIVDIREYYDEKGGYYRYLMLENQ